MLSLLILLFITLCPRTLLAFGVSEYAHYSYGPQWVAQKFNHSPTSLSQSMLRTLCQTDMSAINKHLDNILIQRSMDSPGHAIVTNYIAKTLNDLGYTTQRHEFTANTPILGVLPFTNIIGTWDATAKRRLVIACHYDSKYFPHATFLGAIDSAFPCAMMLYLADVLRGYMGKPTTSDLTLELLFLDGEEAIASWSDTDSLYGARELANLWANELFPPNNPNGSRRLDQIDVFVLLDLLGSADSSVHNYGQNVASLYQYLPQTEAELKQLGCLQPRSLPQFTSRLQYSGSEGIQDDHIPFLRKGVRILHLIANPFPRVWHTVRDDRQALDNASMYNLAAIMKVFVAKYLHLDPTTATQMPTQSASVFSPFSNYLYHYWR